MSIFQQTNRDFLTKSMLIMTFLPSVIMFAISILVGFIYGEGLFSIMYTKVTSYLSIDPNTLIEGSWWLSILSYFDFLIYIFKFLFYLIILYISWNIAILIGMIIVGFFAPYVVQIIQKRHYPDIHLQGDFSIIEIVVKSLKIVATTLVLALVGMVFFWIPGVNFIFFYIAFYYLFDKMLIVDVASEINTKAEIDFILKENLFRIKKHSFSLYLLNNIPIVGILFQIYTVIYMTHFFMLETKKIRNLKENDKCLI